MMHLRRVVPALVAALLLPGCASPTTGVGYYWQSVTGHLALMRAARPVDDWLAQAQGGPSGVLGDAAGDFLGIDMGL